ncbi:hypothetical protein PTTG_11571 [Puccinia triticina 1-1 BBBD Race 1]|uniref:Uncharacterized protein n=1 Tax=Puccinia triticina (isolate 1-1 / race 1 (BBBD)) TaxID=630390 RepID=A0A0C4FEB5_PUCT1|nr:hypothetical protein PTTG_11571 [Puccinia triticina 1-1 BBBD Race 1]
MTSEREELAEADARALFGDAMMAMDPLFVDLGSHPRASKIPPPPTHDVDNGQNEDEDDEEEEEEDEEDSTRDLRPLKEALGAVNRRSLLSGGSEEDDTTRTAAAS